MRIPGFLPLLASSLLASGCTAHPPPQKASSEVGAASTSATTASTPTPLVEVLIGAKDSGAATVDASASVAPEGMLLVAGGTFTMGADKGGEEDEHPAHEVTLASFYLDRTEVTNRAYEACVAEKACHRKILADVVPNAAAFDAPDGPVVGVTAFDAEAYCAWRGKRLPREAEFERAVRGEDGRKYPWGNDMPTRAHTVFASKAPEAVGTHALGRGPYGHEDLAGNVWEWMSDPYDPYAYKRAGASKGEPGTCKEILEAQEELRREGREGYTGSNPIPRECERSIRGGAYNYDAFGLRSTNRVHHPPTFHLRMTGIRCAKSI